MNDQEHYLEQTWNGLLSREGADIARAYSSLDESSRDKVFEHLLRMTQEAGWHVEQVLSAHIALEVIHKIKSE